MLTVLFRCIVAERTSAWKQVPRAGERICMSSVRTGLQQTQPRRHPQKYTTEIK